MPRMGTRRQLCMPCRSHSDCIMHVYCICRFLCHWTDWNVCVSGREAESVSLSVCLWCMCVCVCMCVYMYLLSDPAVG